MLGSRWPRSIALMLLLLPFLHVSVFTQPALAVNPTSLTLQALKGTNVPNKTIQITNSGTGTLKWSIVAPTASWLSVSPASGTGNGNLTLTFRTSALAAGTYQTSVQITSNAGSAVTVPVKVTISSVAQLTVTCPANKTVASSNGSAVAVTYSVTTSGGVAPITVTGTPASGSLFPVGTTAVKVTAKSTDGQTATCGFSVTVTYTASTPTTSTTYGPRSTITCPSGSVAVSPGTSIQNLVNSYAGTTTFCLKAGTHYLKASITPKTGNTFVGEYGAILNGTGWSTTDSTQAAFRAHNQDIDSVTIRNLVIRNMPQRGIHAFYYMSNNWTIEYNEITANNQGVLAPSNSIIRYNKIHHNPNGGYMGWMSSATTYDSNEIAYNGGNQKITGTTNTVFRNNFVHHNVSDGIWFDTNNLGVLIEGNRVEDNGREGIAHEIGGSAVIRNNTVRRTKSSAIFIGTSKDTEIYGNVLEDNYRGIQFFLNCAAVGGGTLKYDLYNVYAHDNSIKVSTQSGAWTTAVSYISSCTSSQVSPYLGGSKSLRFVHNTYRVPSLMTKYWVWGLSAFKYWVEWQKLGQDTTGVAVLY
jgi:hypothetical protein